MLQNVKSEMDSSRNDAIESALRSQYDTLHGNYLKLLQQQAGSLMDVLHQKPERGLPKLEEIQQRFVDVLQDMPDLWRASGGETGNILGAISGESVISTPTVSTDRARNSDYGLSIDTSLKPLPTRDGVPNSPIASPFVMSRLSKGKTTPLHLIARESEKTLAESSSDDAKPKPLPWSSPALRSSPTDQLIAAILDGDVQGIRAVVRSKGDGLNSFFWKDAVQSILPLHRAVSGLHFHGSEKLLVSSLEALIQLGADLGAADNAGNTVLHKTIQVTQLWCIQGHYQKCGF